MYAQMVDFELAQAVSAAEAAAVANPGQVRVLQEAVAILGEARAALEMVAVLGSMQDNQAANDTVIRMYWDRALNKHVATQSTEQDLGQNPPMHES